MKKKCDSDAESATWWPRRRAEIRAELSKDPSLRTSIVALLAHSAAPGSFALEAYHCDFPMPLATIWFGFVGLDAIQINNIYTFEPMRRCGLMSFLQRTMLTWYPGRRLVTGAGTKLGRAWMLANGWKKTAAGWERRPKKSATR
jgi:hypothetical protein